MQKFLLLFIAMVLFMLPATAQKNLHSITVTVTDPANGQLIDLSVLQLMKAGESKAFKAGLTNKRGKLQFDSVPNGSYWLRCSFVGFQLNDTSFVLADNTPRLYNIHLQLQPDSKQLKDVTVTGKKSMLNTSIDRKIYNVGQDIMAQSGSVSDLLKNVPSVEIDIEGNVSLRGSAEVMILINGRPSPLMGKNRAEVLQQIPANTIDRIEVITNPSARFRPDGTAGIINIVLKRNNKAGFSGSVTGNAGNHERKNGGINFNLRKGNLNTFVSYNIRQDERNRFGSIHRENVDSNGKTSGFYSETSGLKSRPLSHFITGGIDYTFDSSNSIGFSGSTLPGRQIRNDVVNRSFFDAANVLTSQYDRLRHAPAKDKESNAVFFWQHKFKEEEHELRFEATTSVEGEDEQNFYSNIYHLPLKRNLFDNNNVWQKEKNKQLILDYTKPLADDAKLELGYAGNFVNTLIDFYVENYDTVQNRFIKDLNTSNVFRYRENLQAAYGTYERSIRQFSFNLGLRAEAAFTTSTLVTRDSVVPNNYVQLYPTLHLAYRHKKNEWQLNYSRRVNRPDGDDLNPFPEYIDPLNLRAGNPKLKPEFIHSVELGYQVKNKYINIVPSLYYRYKYNGFTSVTKQLNDTVLLTTRENLSNDQSAGLELIVSTKSISFVSASLSTNVFYNIINASNLGGSSHKSIVSMSTNFNSVFTLTKTTMFQFTCIYRSARQMVQGKSFPSFVVNMGARQNLFSDKLSVTLTLSDVFKTLQQETFLQTPFLTQTSFNRRDARIFYLGISYRFGKSGKKQAEEKLQFDNSLQ